MFGTLKKGERREKWEISLVFSSLLKKDRIKRKSNLTDPNNFTGVSVESHGF